MVMCMVFGASGLSAALFLTLLKPRALFRGVRSALTSRGSKETAALRQFVALAWAETMGSLL
jgi:hypothetical protein